MARNPERHRQMIELIKAAGKNGIKAEELIKKMGLKTAMNLRTLMTANDLIYEEQEDRLITYFWAGK